MTALRSSFDKLIADLEAQQQASLSANQKRYEQMIAIYDKGVSRYQPGGAFEKAALSDLEARKTQDVGETTQGLINAGLFGTTVQAGVGGRWEKEVGSPTRLKIEDIAQQRLTEAERLKAGAIERVEDIGPDYGMVAGLAGQIGQGGYGMRTINRGDPIPSFSGTRPAPQVTPAATDYAKINAEIAKRAQAASAPTFKAPDANNLISDEDWNRILSSKKQTTSTGSISNSVFKKTLDKFPLTRRKRYSAQLYTPKAFKPPKYIPKRYEAQLYDPF